MVTPKPTETRTCQHCGYTGEDVVIRREPLGSNGWIIMCECENRTKCWKRRDIAHNFWFAKECDDLKVMREASRIRP